MELCLARYRAITGQEEEREIKISELLSGGKLYLLLVQWFLAYIQRKMGGEMGVKPGSEMLAAIGGGKKIGGQGGPGGQGHQHHHPALLVGHEPAGQGQTGLVPASRCFWPGRGDEEIDIDSITQDDIVSQMISEFRKISPGAANVLVDERDAFLARNLYLLSKQGRVLAVVGAGHREGITRHLRAPGKDPGYGEAQ